MKTPGKIRLPLDRRAIIKALGDDLVKDITSWKTEFDGVEDEFFYRIPGFLKTSATQFEHKVKKMAHEQRLSSAELSITCRSLARASEAAKARDLIELCDWLHIEEQNWKIRMHFRSREFTSAALLWSIGLTTGYGRSLKRWIFSLVMLILSFAALSHNMLDYGTKDKTFWSSLYWSIVTISTLGYGDITPKSPQTMIFAGLEAILGLIIFLGLGLLVAEKTKR